MQVQRFLMQAVPKMLYIFFVVIIPCTLFKAGIANYDHVHIIKFSNKIVLWKNNKQNIDIPSKTIEKFTGYTRTILAQ